MWVNLVHCFSNIFEDLLVVDNLNYLTVGPEIVPKEYTALYYISR